MLATCAFKFLWMKLCLLSASLQDKEEVPSVRTCRKSRQKTQISLLSNYFSCWCLFKFKLNYMLNFYQNMRLRTTPFSQIRCFDRIRTTFTCVYTGESSWPTSTNNVMTSSHQSHDAELRFISELAVWNVCLTCPLLNVQIPQPWHPAAAVSSGTLKKMRNITFSFWREETNPAKSKATRPVQYYFIQPPPLPTPPLLHQIPPPKHHHLLPLTQRTPPLLPHLPLSISQLPGSCRAWLEPEFCPIHHPYQEESLAVLRRAEEEEEEEKEREEDF